MFLPICCLPFCHNLGLFCAIFIQLFCVSLSEQRQIGNLHISFGFQNENTYYFIIQLSYSPIVLNFLKFKTIEGGDLILIKKSCRLMNTHLICVLMRRHDL